MVVDCPRVAHVSGLNIKLTLGFRVSSDRPRFGRVSVSISKYYVPFTQGASVILPAISFAV